MELIDLTQGRVARVDESDWEALSKYNWYACWMPTIGSFYAVRNTSRKDGPRRLVYMHRVIMGVTDPKVQVDHIYHDTLDNRRSKLRIVNNRTNCGNLKGKAEQKYSSVYPGVSFRKDIQRWRAYISIGGRFVHLGYFDDEVEAAKTYQVALERTK